MVGFLRGPFAHSAWCRPQAKLAMIGPEDEDDYHASRFLTEQKEAPFSVEKAEATPSSGSANATATTSNNNAPSAPVVSNNDPFSNTFTNDFHQDVDL